MFTGGVAHAELPAHYAAGDVFAMPCRTRRAGLDVEGLGIVYLEASATGLPVVAGDSGGAPDAVRDGETGYVVDGRDVHAVAERLVTLLHDADAARAAGRGRPGLGRARLALGRPRRTAGRSAPNRSRVIMASAIRGGPMRVPRLCVVIGLIVAGLVTGPAAAQADQPGTPGGVTHSGRLDKTLTGRITSPTDEDWFRFDLKRSGRFLVRLTDLPANLRLDLFDKHRDRVSRSTRPWRQFEEIYRHLDARTYYVRVSSQNGTYDAHRSYHLRFTYLTPGVHVLSKSHWRRGYGNVTFACDMVNNTPHWQLFITVELQLVDASGTVYAEGDGGPSPDLVPPHGRTDCEVDFSVKVLRRLDHVRVVHAVYERTPLRNSPISVLPGRRSPNPPYGTEFHGRLRNDGNTRLHHPDVELTFFGPAGQIRSMEPSLVSKRWLAPGATTRYLVNSAQVGLHAFFRADTYADGSPARG